MLYCDHTVVVTCQCKTFRINAGSTPRLELVWQRVRLAFTHHLRNCINRQAGITWGTSMRAAASPAHRRRHMYIRTCLFEDVCEVAGSGAEIRGKLRGKIRGKRSPFSKEGVGVNFPSDEDERKKHHLNFQKFSRQNFCRIHKYIATPGDVRSLHPKLVGLIMDCCSTTLRKFNPQTQPIVS